MATPDRQPSTPDTARPTPNGRGRGCPATPLIRARIEEIAAETDNPSIQSMEQARGLLYQRLMDIAGTCSSPTAAVQAARVMGNFLLMGEAGARLKVQQEKLDLEREQIQLQRDALEAARAGQNVTVNVQYGRTKTE